MSADDVHPRWSEDELDTALATLRSDVDTDPTRLARDRATLLAAATSAAETVPERGAEPAVRRLAGPPANRRRWLWPAAAVVDEPGEEPAR